MGVVNTTYTFTSTDTITSAKMNNIIDDTTFTSDAIQGTTLQVVSPGKLAVSAGGITSNELASNSVVTAAITDSNVTTAKIADSNVTTAKIADSNVTQAKLAANVVGNGPAFKAHASTTTSVPSGALTKINLATENFDTNSYFSSSRFTPLVAGYYMIVGSVDFVNVVSGVLAIIFKNGSQHTIGSGNSNRSSQVSDLIYMNGSTDYIELMGYQTTGSTQIIPINPDGVYLSGFLARSA
jgi:hypothetical protein